MKKDYSDSYNVKTTENSISISNQSEDEILYWDIAEWVESPETTLTIINAVVMALTKPNEFQKTIKIIKGK